MATAFLESSITEKPLRPHELSSELLEQWRLLQQATPFQSPFFSPEFFCLVGKVRPDVFVLPLLEQGRVVGFFPFQRQARLGLPVGYPLADFQGVIGQSVIGSGELALSEHALLQCCELDRFDFNHWVATQSLFSQHHWAVHDSPFVDTSAGFQAYCESVSRRGGSFVQSTQRKLRKLEREVGPLRFELHTTADQVLQQMIIWKQEQYAARKAVDCFAFGWIHELCDRLRFMEAAEFTGRMSALYAGDHLVAVHLGPYSSTVAHMWFPAYNPAFERYSPGMILLLLLIEELATRGFIRLDLGKGEERFKESCKSGDLQVAVGAIDRNRLRGYALRTGYRAKRWARRSPLLYAAVDLPSRLLRSVYRTRAMR